IVLVRKAASVKHASLASWLHGVAYRVSLEARTRARQRQAHETTSPEAVLEINGRPGNAHPAGGDLGGILDEEVERLPEKYRAAILLCYFEGKTLDVASQLLGCQASAVGMRLLRARDLLRNRLARRGVVLSEAALAAGLAEEASAAALVPPALVASTSRAA